MPHISRMLLVAAFAAVPLAAVASAQSFAELEARLEAHPSLLRTAVSRQLRRRRGTEAHAPAKTAPQLGAPRMRFQQGRVIHTFDH